MRPLFLPLAAILTFTLPANPQGLEGQLDLSLLPAAVLVEHKGGHCP